MHYLDLKIPPLAVFLVFAIAIIAFGYYAPSTRLLFPGHIMMAIAAAIAAIVVGAAAIVQFRRASTTVNPMVPERTSAIVVTGVYRFSRNPMYLGMALGLLGLAAWQSTLPGYAMVPLYCLYMTQFQIKPEEHALRAAFNDEFAAYTARVRRWI